ncbi:MAG: hypothetical protein U9R50_05635, partial [Campylobacterota bacterium]|nr:hypothetical protein [Campylobacterota bacterium]
ILEAFESDQNTSVDLRSKRIVQNEAVYITSQCYTKTEDENGNVHNPCMNCHINSKRPNYMDDWDLQESLPFNEYTKVNRFINLFKDRTDLVDAISDETIMEYVREDNYLNNEGQIILAEQLKRLPETWDYNENGSWDGYVPDCHFNFDSEGFDKDMLGNFTGWRAFGYYPFLGTFWPTNGSTDDVLIRLPDIFQQNSEGNFDLDAYKINLAIVEAMIKETNITIEETDERQWGVDLDKDGEIATASQITYDWAPLEERYMSYVGKAKEVYDEALKVNLYLPMAAGLYPEGTEFLHTVRYIDIVDNAPTMASRMKELRYGRKYSWNTYPQIQNAVLAEIKEKHDFSERLRTVMGNVEEGVQTSYGWVYQGFIEDVDGYLRPQTYEENMYCVGCHSTIGAIVDSTFVFPRKFDHNAKQMGWYHWTQTPNAFKDMKEPKLADGRYEYTLYLEENHAGDEFRDNKEVIEKFFNEDGSLIASEVEKLHKDISHLIIPSTQRAIMLNKAYRVIVDEQSYIYGRDPHVKPVKNVHERVNVDQSTGVTAVTMDRYPLQ